MASGLLIDESPIIVVVHNLVLLYTLLPNHCGTRRGNLGPHRSSYYLSPFLTWRLVAHPNRYHSSGSGRSNKRLGLLITDELVALLRARRHVILTVIQVAATLAGYRTDDLPLLGLLDGGRLCSRG